MTETEWLEAFLTQYAKAYKKNATDLLIAPVFKSSKASVRYRADGTLKDKDLPFRVPKKVTKVKGTVTGRLVKDQFIVYPNDTETRSPVLQMHLATSDKFKTIMPLVSWWGVTGQKSDGSPVLRSMSSDRDEVIAQYFDRLKVTQRVLEGKRARYWSKEKGKGERLLPISQVFGLQIIYSPSYELRSKA